MIKREVNVMLSRSLAEMFQTEIQQCFKNSLTVFLVYFAADTRAHYVESFAIMSEPVLLPFEHGWIEIEYEDHIEVIDTTLILSNTDEEMLEYTYIEGPSYTQHEASKLLEKSLPQAWRKKGKREAWQKAQDVAFAETFGISITDLINLY